MLKQRDNHQKFDDNDIPDFLMPKTMTYDKAKIVIFAFLFASLALIVYLAINFLQGGDGEGNKGLAKNEMHNEIKSIDGLENKKTIPKVVMHSNQEINNELPVIKETKGMAEESISADQIAEIVKTKLFETEVLRNKLNAQSEQIQNFSAIIEEKLNEQETKLNQEYQSAVQSLANEIKSLKVNNNSLVEAYVNTQKELEIKNKEIKEIQGENGDLRIQIANLNITLSNRASTKSNLETSDIVINNKLDLIDEEDSRPVNQGKKSIEKPKKRKKQSPKEKLLQAEENVTKEQKPEKNNFSVVGLSDDSVVLRLNDGTVKSFKKGESYKDLKILEINPTNNSITTNQGVINI